MSEVKDPKIKLFGRTIQLPETSTAAVAAAGSGGGEESLSQEPPCSSNSCNLEDGDFDAEEHGSLKSDLCPKQDYMNAEENQDRSLTSPEGSKDFNNQSPASVDDSKTDEDPSESEVAQEKTLRKPDKIIPCPRCNSMDTKFCYFNNYNVNQPRHFCKNCQRYWTAGGMMRNVPVGAGRRKNKSTASQIHHLTIPPNGVHHHDGTLLTFNSDSPLCESMASALIIADKNGSQNRAHDPISDGDNPCGSPSPQGETGLSRLSGPDPKYHPFPQPCYPGAPWPYPIHLGPSSFPLPFYSTTPPYFSPVAPHYSWNAPCFYPTSGPMSQVPLDLGPTSPTLRKHSRDETIPKPADQEEGKHDAGNLWVPKTLRIDDPGNAAAKSSIWATLGIKNEGSDSIGGGGLVKALQSRSKVEERMKDRENSAILQANPAALSRSIQFHESM